MDNGNLRAATEREIIVTSSVGINTQSVVEHALTMILSLFKRIRIMGKAVRENDFKIR